MVPAEIALPGHDVALVGHRGDHRVRGGLVELRGVGGGDAGQVPRALDHDALQAQAQAEQRNGVLGGRSGRC